MRGMQINKSIISFQTESSNPRFVWIMPKTSSFPLGHISCDDILIYIDDIKIPRLLVTMELENVDWTLQGKEKCGFVRD